MFAPNIIDRPVTVVLRNEGDSEGIDVAQALICGKNGNRYLVILPDGVAMATYNGPKSENVLTLPNLTGYFESTDGRDFDFLKSNDFRAWCVHFDSSIVDVANSLEYIEKGIQRGEKATETALANIIIHSGTKS